ncbi:MAG: hypothetical protein JWP27_308 [Flaviaesturariibacter sp.]|nr:hypothetical protein [Flaviaesturariibacter sp.]
MPTSSARRTVRWITRIYNRKQEIMENKDQESKANGANGVVTVNDDNNPTREERDRAIPNEPDTDRLRSERQSVRDAEQKGQSV